MRKCEKTGAAATAREIVFLGVGPLKEAKRLHKAQDDTIEEYLGRLTFEDNDDSSW